MDDPAADGIDRRSSTRRACLLGARYNLGTGWHPAALVDLSARGCRLRVGEDLARGAAVRVQLTSPAERGRAPVELAGVVVWCRLEGISHQVGVHFGDPPPDLMDLLEAAAG
ncbi:MAG TPA: PilZ domain-containing protein [Vicinamibacteria bacterium]|nr:PilZ domain-containing protein [Vicinamibacteria bacterium]